MPRAEKTEHCKSCPAYDAPGRCLGLGPSMAHIAFVSGAPKEEVTRYAYNSFSDSIGSFFKYSLESLQKKHQVYNHVRYYMIHAAQCVVEKESAEILEHCRQIVHKQLVFSGAQTIVALGASACKSLGLSGSISELRGKIFDTTIGGKPVKVLPTYNPGALLRKENTGLLQTFQGDLQKALNLAIGTQNVASIAEMTKNYRIAKTVAEGRAVLQEIKEFYEQMKAEGKPTLLSVDSETTGLNTYSKDFRVIALSFSWKAGYSAGILLNHREMKDDWRELLPDLKEILESDMPKVFHNYQFDYKAMDLATGFQTNAVSWDTMIAEYLLDENKQGLYGLKQIVRSRVPEFTDYEKKIKEQLRSVEDFKDQIENNKKEQKKLIEEKKRLTAERKSLPREQKPLHTAMIENRTFKLEILKSNLAVLKDKVRQNKLDAANKTFEDLDVDDMLLYAAIDTDCTRRICVQQYQEMYEDDPELINLLREHIIPAARTLGRMEHEGIRIDLEYLSKLEREFQEIADATKEEIFTTIGEEFNLNSTADLIRIFTQKLGIQLTKKTRKGQVSVDKAVLDELSKAHPLAKKVLTFRKATKAKDTFLKGIREGSREDGRLHGSYSLTGTATGRLSSSNPNMQNIPARGILGKNVKKLFIPDSDDEVFVNMDYSGAEIRVLTAYAHDEGLITTLNSGLNIHSFVASQIFGDSYEDIENRGQWKETDFAKYLDLDLKRQIAKSTVFLTIYGGGAQKLWENNVKAKPDWTLADAEQTIGSFLDRFPIIRVYMDYIRSMVDKKCYVQSKFGRKRRFPLSRVDWKLKNASYREGINFPVQSTSSDLVVAQLVEMDGLRHVIGLKPRVTVHDSIGFSMPKTSIPLVRDYLDKYAQARIIEKFPWLPVPFEYEAEYGPSYGECKTVIKK